MECKQPTQAKSELKFQMQIIKNEKNTVYESVSLSSFATERFLVLDFSCFTSYVVCL